MKQRPQNQQRRPERRGPESAMRGQPRRDQRPQRQPAPVMPWEQEQERVRKEQLEYARQQAAQERSSEPQQVAQQEAPARRSEPQPERKRDKQPQTPALFGFVGKKVG
jgi:hypothetical protein